MATQRAILVTEIGKPCVAVSTHPIPQPTQSQIQVKVTIAGLNPHDQKARDFGLFIKDALPAIGANDIVGVVSQLGSENHVSNLKIGDRVVSHGGFSKSWDQQALQEYAVEEAAYSCRIPDGISDNEAATLPTNLIAGVVGIFVALGVAAPWVEGGEKTATYKDSSILVVGGGSNCGIFGVQLAKLAGFGTIVVVGGSVDQLKELGATEVIDRHLGEDVIVERIRGIVGDELLYAYDAINPPTGQSLAIKALSNKKKGSLARLLARLPRVGGMDESCLRVKEAGVEIKDVLGISALHPELCSAFWKALPGYLEAGAIRPTPYVTVKGLTAENANAILDGYRDGKKMIKTHIHV